MSFFEFILQHPLTTLYFFVLTWGLGYSSTFFVENSNFLERNIMRIGIGLGVLPFLLSLINLLKIPINWWIFLIIALITPLIYILKQKKFSKFVLKDTSNIFILIIFLLFIGHLFMMVTGEASVPFLHDTDPYGFVGTAKYIAEEKTMFDKTDWSKFNITKDFTSYSDPYCGSYSGIMAILYQTSDQIMWTLKFFNALIISLGILFFYFAMKRFTGKKWIALSSTFVLAFIPSYLSHFIWAHALVPTLFLVALYCLERLRKDWKWIIPSILVIASIGVTSPTSTFNAYVMLGIYFLIKLIFKDKWKYILASLVIGGLLAACFWWIPVAVIHGGARNIADESLAKISSNTTLIGSLLTVFNPNEGSATRAYTFNDFFGASENNMINQPVGWGPVIFILLIAFFALFLLYCFTKKKEEKYTSWIWITIVWFIFTFLGVNSMTFHLPIGLFAFRFWMFLAIPVSILTGYTIYLLADLVSNINIFKNVKKIIFILFIISILTTVGITSGIPKYKLNTMPWGTYFGYQSEKEMQGLLETRFLPKDTKIISYSGCSSVFLSYDLECCQWCEDEIKFQTEVTNMYLPDLYFWLRDHNYQILTVGIKDIKFHYTIGGNETLQRIIPIIQGIGESDLFEVLYQNEDMAIFRVKAEAVK